MGSAQHRPIWAGIARLERQELREYLEAEVCVIGGGIAGLSVAYQLSRSGKKVALLESRTLGAGDTGVTTAHLSSALDDRFSNLERLVGDEKAGLAYESHQSAIEAIEETTLAEGIDCDFARLDGYLFLAEGDSPDLLDQEREAAFRAGFSDVERLERVPDATFDSGPCLRFPRQARFHPLKYLAGLAEAIERRGGHIFTGSHVEEFSGGDQAVAWTREGFTVHAQAIVVATNIPANLVAIHTKQAPYRTYAIGAPVPAGSVPDALYWDTGDPYHYVRLQRLDDDRLILIVGGEDHPSGHDYEAGGRFERLAKWSRARFPITEVEFQWSGQVMEPIDGMAYIGRNPMDADNVYVATGDSGHGMTHGAIAGLLIRDLILGRENPWERLYDPSRVNFRGAQDFFKNNLHVAKHYAEWLSRRNGRIEDADETPAGSGRVLWRGRQPIAVYRDEAGELHEHSAVCTHLGCIVHWNDVEHTWDCPCHGSSFGPEGEVIHGPAASSLEAGQVQAVAPARAYRRGRHKAV